MKLITAHLNTAHTHYRVYRIGVIHILTHSELSNEFEINKVNYSDIKQYLIQTNHLYIPVHKQTRVRLVTTGVNIKHKDTL